MAYPSFLKEVLQPGSTRINNQIKEFYKRGSLHKKPPCAAFLADYRFPSAKVTFSKADLQRRLMLAVGGLLSGAQRAVSNDIAKIPPQNYYFELPLLITESHPHGIGIPEILECWKMWMDIPNLPESKVCKMVENGVPADKSGAYQPFSIYHTATVTRVLGWALLNAGNPENAAKRAFTDAFITARGDALHTAVFFVCSIAMAFCLPPSGAVDAALQMLPVSLAERITEGKKLSFPLLQCHFLCRAVETESLSAGFLLLEQLHAESCCFEALGGICGASGNPAAVIENRIVRSGSSADILPLDDLAKRMLACHSAFSAHEGKPYPWEKTE